MWFNCYQFELIFYFYLKRMKWIYTVLLKWSLHCIVIIHILSVICAFKFTFLRPLNNSKFSSYFFPTSCFWFPFFQFKEAARPRVEHSPCNPEALSSSPTAPLPPQLYKLDLSSVFPILFSLHFPLLHFYLF